MQTHLQEWCRNTATAPSSWSVKRSTPLHPSADFLQQLQSHLRGAYDQSGLLAIAAGTSMHQHSDVFCLSMCFILEVHAQVVLLEQHSPHFLISSWLDSMHITFAATMHCGGSVPTPLSCQQCMAPQVCVHERFVLHSVLNAGTASSCSRLESRLFVYTAMQPLLPASKRASTNT